MNITTVVFLYVYVISFIFYEKIYKLGPPMTKKNRLKSPSFMSRPHFSLRQGLGCDNLSGIKA